MEAGPELDALIAEKVMGWENVRFEHGHGWVGRVQDGPTLDLGEGFRRIPRFSTDIKAAWEVVQKVGLLKTHTLEQSIGDDVIWIVADKVHRLSKPFYRAPTAPHAICLAALETVEK